MEEDQTALDFTSMLLKNSGSQQRAHILAKSSGLWCASGLLRAVERLSLEQGRSIQVSRAWEEKIFKKGSILCEWKGPAHAILAYERSFLNIASWVCSVAWTTKQYVERVEKSRLKKKPRICPTRKILPGLRDLAIFSVMQGGGSPHRVGLAGGILIKENHIKVEGGVDKVLNHFSKGHASFPHTLKTEIEVRNLNEFKDALQGGAEVTMLDHFSIRDIQKAVHIRNENNPSMLIEISGGVNLENIQKYLIEGVDIISIGSLTYAPTPVDLSLMIV